MGKKLVLWVASFALFLAIFIYTDNAKVHNEEKVTPYGSYITKEELVKLKDQTRKLYEKELSMSVAEPVAVADTCPGYALNYGYGPGRIVILKTKMPYEEKQVYRYVTYVRENQTDAWKRLDEYQNSNCNRYDC